MLGSRQSTRDLAVTAVQEIRSHVDGCERKWEQTDGAIRSLQNDLNAKHAENQRRLQEDRDSLDKFQKRILLFVIAVFAAIVFKGTPLDLITKILGAL